MFDEIIINFEKVPPQKEKKNLSGSLDPQRTNLFYRAPPSGHTLYCTGKTINADLNGVN